MSDDLQTLIDRATPEPDEIPDFGELVARAARRRALSTAATVVVAVIALVAGAVVLWPSPDRMPTIDQAPPAPAGELAPAIPEGWQEVVVGGASLGVPAAWEVGAYSPDEPFLCQAGVGPSRIAVVDPSHPGSALKGSVYSCPSLFRPEGLGLIGGPISDPSSDRVLMVDGQARMLDATTINGMSAFETTFADDYEEDVHLVTIPELDAWLYATDVDRDPETFDRIVTTLAPAGQQRADQRAPQVPARWQPVNAGDANLGVPAEWNVTSIAPGGTWCSTADTPRLTVAPAPLGTDGPCIARGPIAPEGLAGPIDVVFGIPGSLPEDGEWRPITTDPGVPGVALVLGDRVWGAQFPTVDLGIRFSGRDPDPVFERILATVAPAAEEDDRARAVNVAVDPQVMLDHGMVAVTRVMDAAGSLVAEQVQPVGVGERQWAASMVLSAGTHNVSVHLLGCPISGCDESDLSSFAGPWPRDTLGPDGPFGPCEFDLDTTAGLGTVATVVHGGNDDGSCISSTDPIGSPVDPAVRR